MQITGKQVTQKAIRIEHAPPGIYKAEYCEDTIIIVPDSDCFDKCSVKVYGLLSSPEISTTVTNNAYLVVPIKKIDFEY